MPHGCVEAAAEHAPSVHVKRRLPPCTDTLLRPPALHHGVWARCDGGKTFLPLLKLRVAALWINLPAQVVDCMPNQQRHK
jgi:hypothetical protein